MTYEIATPSVTTPDGFHMFVHLDGGRLEIFALSDYTTGFQVVSSSCLTSTYIGAKRFNMLTEDFG